MRVFTALILLCLGLYSQDTRIDLNGKGVLVGPPEGSPADGFGRQFSPEDIIYLEGLAPFYHGVASGDPTQSSVIIWSRVTTEVDGPVEVTYKMATDIELNNVVAEGTLDALPDNDYCVKNDVTGLDAGKTYYYQFEYEGKKSIIGRTKTLPAAGTKEHLRLAVISCVNYQWGYFNALERIAEREDLDAVIHMGDYIYEYASDYYSHPDHVANFPHTPDKEIVTMADYRLRYSQYRLDPMMIKMHQQHPMIAVWDDHESTNDAYRDGAENHQEGEGEWNERVQIATDVYAEWMPIRLPNENNKTQIYRDFQFGDMLDLYMMELRLTGKDEPMGSKASGGPITDLPQEDLANVFNQERKMIDNDQFNWLIGGLSQSQAQWKIMGSSVMMAPFAAFFNPDGWDGYYVQRETIFGALLQAGVQNIGAISGDFHMSFASNLITAAFDPATESVPLGFEFTTPSVTSANINEQEQLPIPNPVNPDETIVINPLELRLPERSEVALGIESQAVSGMPNFHFANVDQHGYMVLDIKEDRIQTDWFYVPVLEESTVESHGASAVVVSGNPLVSMTDEGPAQEKTNPPALAPFPDFTSVQDDGILPMGIFPNPASHTTQLSFAVNKAQRVKISLFDVNGNEVALIANDFFDKGVQAISMNITNYPSGSYFVKIQTDQNSEFSPLKIVK